jgi:site-specific recombinase XerD
MASRAFIHRLSRADSRASVPVRRQSVAPIKEPVFRDSLTIRELSDAVTSWLIDSEIRLSGKTVGDRKFITGKLLWWYRENREEVCDKRSLQRFFHYLATAHLTPGGRWGTDANPSTDTDAFKEIRPRSRANYFRWLRTFFLWCVADGLLDASPMVTLSAPVHKDDQIVPFTLEQVSALLRACKGTKTAHRDTALIMLLLDTGARASEITGLDYEDFSMSERHIRVKGKGNSHRMLPLSAATMKAVMTYLRAETREPGEPLFTSIGGHKIGQRLEAGGLGQTIRAIGLAAGIDGVRCSPHTFRHTFAIEFLRSGGDLLTLQTMYGHSDLAMTRKYLMIAQADVTRKHKAHSPVNRLKK